MTTKQVLHRLIEELDEQMACEVLDYVNQLLSDSDVPTDEDLVLTEEELAQVREAKLRMDRGEYITLDQLEQELGL